MRFVACSGRSESGFYTRAAFLKLRNSGHRLKKRLVQHPKTRGLGRGSSSESRPQSEIPDLGHSHLNATIGSTFVALRAGK